MNVCIHEFKVVMQNKQKKPKNGDKNQCECCSTMLKFSCKGEYTLHLGRQKNFLPKHVHAWVGLG